MMSIRPLRTHAGASVIASSSRWIPGRTFAGAGRRRGRKRGVAVRDAVLLAEAPPSRGGTGGRAIAVVVAETFEQARAALDRRTLYRWRDTDPRFRERWDKALLLREEELLDRGYSLARTGVPRYVFRDGVMTATYRRHDERLIMFMLGRMRARPSNQRTDGDTP